MIILFALTCLAFEGANGQVKYTELSDRLTLAGAGYSRIKGVNAYSLQIGNTRDGRIALGLLGSITTLPSAKTLSLFLEGGLSKPDSVVQVGFNLLLSGSLLWYPTKMG